MQSSHHQDRDFITAITFTDFHQDKQSIIGAPQHILLIAAAKGKEAGT
jgi:hypothetical protein